MSNLPPMQVGWCDDGAPLMKDASTRGFEQWLDAMQTAQECTELRQLITEHPRLTPERKAFYGRALAIKARLELGLKLNPSTGVYAPHSPA